MVRVSSPRGLRHAAFFYDSDETLTASAASFVREGVERDEVVLVKTGSNPVTAILREAFGDEPKVRFSDSIGSVGPVRVIDQAQRTMDKGLASGARAFRSIGFIDLDAGPPHWLEWLRFEAVVNRVFADYPLHALCPYDTRSVTPEQLTAMRRAHPLMGGVQGAEDNEAYVDPLGLVTRPEYSLKTDPLQLEPPQLELADVQDLHSLRIDLYPAMLSTALSRKRADDFVKAVGEVVINARAHGVRPVDLRLWFDADTLICAVTDQGAGIDDPFVGYARPASATKSNDKLGLWAARQLCDTLDYERTDEGFTVRVSVVS